MNPIAEHVARARRLRRARPSTRAATGSRAASFDLDGPREVAGRARTCFAWLTARPDVDAQHVGAFGHLARRRRGLALGASRACRSRRSSRSRRGPTSTTRSSRRTCPSRARSSSFLGSIPPSRTDAGARRAEGRRCSRARTSRRIRALRATALELDGSSARCKTPTFMLPGPARLRVRDRPGRRTPTRSSRARSGSTSATSATRRRRFPRADAAFYLVERKPGSTASSRASRTGSTRAAPVELAPDPWTGKTAKYCGPRRGHVDLRLAFRGAKTIAPAGKVVRTVKLPRRAKLETFGAPVRPADRLEPTGWSHLVAVLDARSRRTARQTVVSEGGAATTLGRTPRRVAIRLIDDATLDPARLAARGSRSRPPRRRRARTTSSTSSASPTGSRVTLGPATLTLPVLRTAGVAVRRLARCSRRCSSLAPARSRARPRDPGVTSTSDPARRHRPAQRPEPRRSAPSAPGAKAYFDYVNDARRRRRAEDRLHVPRRRLRPGAAPCSRRASSSRRTSVFAIFNSVGTEHNARDRAAPERSSGSRSSSAAPARAPSRKPKRVPVDARLPAELLRRGRDLRALPRDALAEGEDRRPLRESRLRQGPARRPAQGPRPARAATSRRRRATTSPTPRCARRSRA